jgi:hypothetical protein
MMMIGIGTPTSQSSPERMSSSRWFTLTTQQEAAGSTPGRHKWKCWLSSSPSHEPQDQKQYDCAKGCAGDDADEASPEINPQSRQNPAADKRADDADDNVAEKAKTAAFDDNAS